MDWNEYQRLAMRTSPDDHDRIENGILGMIGEGGEVIDLIKKWKFQSGENAPLPKEELIEELGDCLWYVAETATGMGEKLSEIYVENFSNGCNTKDKDELPKMAISFILDAITLSRTNIIQKFCLSHCFSILVKIIDKIGSSIEEVAEKNIEKLKKRYPDGFDPDRSINRKEYGVE